MSLQRICRLNRIQENPTLRRSGFRVRAARTSHQADPVHPRSKEILIPLAPVTANEFPFRLRPSLPRSFHSPDPSFDPFYLRAPFAFSPSLHSAGSLTFILFLYSPPLPLPTRSHDRSEKPDRLNHPGSLRKRTSRSGCHLDHLRFCPSFFLARCLCVPALFLPWLQSLFLSPFHSLPVSAVYSRGGAKRLGWVFRTNHFIYLWLHWLDVEKARSRQRRRRSARAQEGEPQRGRCGEKLASRTTLRV